MIWLMIKMKRYKKKENLKLKDQWEIDSNNRIAKWQ